VFAGLAVFKKGAVLPVQREAVVIEITFRVRSEREGVEITKVVVPAGNVKTWAKNCVTLANRPVDPATEKLIFSGDSSDSG
jgi:hypothetical protein